MVTQPAPVRNAYRHRHLPHYVYEFYGTDGEPVYVGCSRVLSDRFRTHERSEMWREVAEIRTTRYRNHDDATEAEASLIRELQPRWNFQHTERASEAARERHRRRRDRADA